MIFHNFSFVDTNQHSYSKLNTLMIELVDHEQKILYDWSNILWCFLAREKTL